MENQQCEHGRGIERGDGHHLCRQLALLALNSLTSFVARARLDECSILRKYIPAGWSKAPTTSISPSRYGDIPDELDYAIAAPPSPCLLCRSAYRLPRPNLPPRDVSRCAMRLSAIPPVGPAVTVTPHHTTAPVPSRENHSIDSHPEPPVAASTPQSSAATRRPCARRIAHVHSLGNLLAREPLPWRGVGCILDEGTWGGGRERTCR